MFHRTNTQTSVSLGVTLGLLLGSLIWVILLLQNAHLLHSRASTSQTVQAGSLQLTTIHQRKIERGHIVSFSLKPGLLWYLGGCIAIGASAGYTIAIQQRTALRKKDD